MPTIEFIYDRDCPNVGGARAALRALKRTQVWQEWDRADQRVPEYVRAYGSPTILADGKDIAGMPPGDVSACRIYRNEQGNARGIPDSQLILAAVQTSGNGKPAGGKMWALAMLPAVGGALLTQAQLRRLLAGLRRVAQRARRRVRGLHAVSAADYRRGARRCAFRARLACPRAPRLCSICGRRCRQRSNSYWKIRAE